MKKSRLKEIIAHYEEYGHFPNDREILEEVKTLNANNVRLKLHIDYLDEKRAEQDAESKVFRCRIKKLRERLLSLNCYYCEEHCNKGLDIDDEMESGK